MFIDMEELCWIITGIIGIVVGIIIPIAVAIIVDQFTSSTFVLIIYLLYFLMSMALGAMVFFSASMTLEKNKVKDFIDCLRFIPSLIINTIINTIGIIAEIFGKRIKEEKLSLMRMEENNMPVDTESEMALTQFEKRVESIFNPAEMFQGAMTKQSAWASYQNKKHMRRASENLVALTEVLKIFATAQDAAVDVSDANSRLQEAETNRQTVAARKSLQNDLETATLRAQIAEQEEKRLGHVSKIERFTNKPPQRPQIDPEEKQRKREAEMERRETKEKEWKQELMNDPDFANEDIQREIENKKRARGWLD